MNVTWESFRQVRDFTLENNRKAAFRPLVLPNFEALNK